MIRKFKHKITGYIATETNSEKNYKVSEPKNFTIPKWIIEDSEDWEEVKEFPMIVSFRAINVNKTIIKIATDGYFNNYSLDSMLYIDGCVDSGHFEIYQVAVSETEVFTLLDKVSVYGNLNKWVIKSFEISDKEFIKVKVVDLCNLELHTDIDSIKKYKEPILVTDDNVEIFEGDEYWCIYYSTLPRGPWKLIKEKCPKFPFSIMTHTVATFKSEELAKKYLEENKPIYSKRQIREAILKNSDTPSWMNSSHTYLQILNFQKELGL